MKETYKNMKNLLEKINYETYENMKNLLDKINYNKYFWNICGDLKISAILLGMRLGYTKYCCFICEWKS
jgi:hypothetical protein